MKKAKILSIFLVFALLMSFFIPTNVFAEDPAPNWNGLVYAGNYSSATSTVLTSGDALYDGVYAKVLSQGTPTAGELVYKVSNTTHFKATGIKTGSDILSFQVSTDGVSYSDINVTTTIDTANVNNQNYAGITYLSDTVSAFSYIKVKIPADNWGPGLCKIYLEVDTTLTYSSLTPATQAYSTTSAIVGTPAGACNFGGQAGEAVYAYAFPVTDLRLNVIKDYTGWMGDLTVYASKDNINYFKISNVQVVVNNNPTHWADEFDYYTSFSASDSIKFIKIGVPQADFAYLPSFISLETNSVASASSYSINIHPLNDIYSASPALVWQGEAQGYDFNKGSGQAIYKLAYGVTDFSIRIIIENNFSNLPEFYSSTDNITYKKVVISRTFVSAFPNGGWGSSYYDFKTIFSASENVKFIKVVFPGSMGGAPVPAIVTIQANPSREIPTVYQSTFAATSAYEASDTISLRGEGAGYNFNGAAGYIVYKSYNIIKDFSQTVFRHSGGSGGLPTYYVSSDNINYSKITPVVSLKAGGFENPNWGSADYDYKAGFSEADNIHYIKVVLPTSTWLAALPSLRDLSINTILPEDLASWDAIQGADQAFSYPANYANGDIQNESGLGYRINNGFTAGDVIFKVSSARKFKLSAAVPSGDYSKISFEISADNVTYTPVDVGIINETQRSLPLPTTALTYISGDIPVTNYIKVKMGSSAWLPTISCLYVSVIASENYDVNTLLSATDQTVSYNNIKADTSLAAAFGYGNVGLGKDNASLSSNIVINNSRYFGSFAVTATAANIGAYKTDAAKLLTFDYSVDGVNWTVTTASYYILKAASSDMLLKYNASGIPSAAKFLRVNIPQSVGSINLFGVEFASTVDVAGDLDNNSEISVLDLIAARNHLLGKAPLGETALAALNAAVDANYASTFTLISLLNYKDFIISMNSQSYMNVLYVDSIGGSDLNDGFSQETPLRSLSATLPKLTNNTALLLKSGSEFDETLNIEGLYGAGQGVVVSSYGQGNKPIINPDSGNGVVITNCANIMIENLRIRAFNGDCGIIVRTTGPNSVSGGCYSDITIKSCDISNVGSTANFNYHTGGIIFMNWSEEQPTWFENVLLKDNTITDVIRSGIFFTSLWVGRPGLAWSLKNTYIDDYNGWYPSENVRITGNAVTRTGGDGIVVIGLRNPLIDHNTVMYAQYYGVSGYANAGIWPQGTVGAVIEYNEVGYTKKPAGTSDAQGYDVDISCNNTIIRNNYSHHNEGGFLLFCTTQAGTHSGTVVQNNLSVADGQVTGELIAVVGDVSDVLIANNTIYAVGSVNKLMTSYGYPAGLKFYNNLVYNNSVSALPLTQAEGAAPSGYEFAGNICYSDIAGYSNCAWNTNGLFVNPLLAAAGASGNGLATGTNYMPAEGSPLNSNGISYTNSPAKDYFGNNTAGFTYVGAFYRN